MRSTEQLLREWRTADRIASTAESLLITQCIAFSEGKAPSPTPEDWDRVRQLRAAANELFGEIMHSVSPGSPGAGPGTSQPLQ